MNAIEVSCRANSPDGELCAAQENEPCIWVGWRFSQPHPEFHAERIEDAASMDANSNPVSKEEFDKAVENELF